MILQSEKKELKSSQKYNNQHYMHLYSLPDLVLVDCCISVMTSTPFSLILVSLDSLIFLLFTMILFDRCCVAHHLQRCCGTQPFFLASATFSPVQFQPHVAIAWDLGEGFLSFLTRVLGMFNLCSGNIQASNLSSSCLDNLGLIYSSIAVIFNIPYFLCLSSA